VSQPTCNRCDTPCPVVMEPTDGGGDPSLLPVLIPPPGWLGDPDDLHGGVVCCACATNAEIVEWMTNVGFADEAMNGPED